MAHSRFNWSEPVDDRLWQLTLQVSNSPIRHYQHPHLMLVLLSPSDPHQNRRIELWERPVSTPANTPLEAYLELQSVTDLFRKRIEGRR